MNNYELARQVRDYDRSLAYRIETARVDVGPHFLQHRKLPFNGISAELVKIVETTIDEAEPDSLRLAA